VGKQIVTNPSHAPVEIGALASFRAMLNRIGIGTAVNLLLRLLKLDKALSLFAVLFLFGTLPSAFTATTSVTGLIYSERNDEPVLTECLESMTVPPFGNPANYWRDPARAPEYWNVLRYTFFVYCGGLQESLAFPVFALLKWSGMSTFPTAPIILRSLSVVAGLLSLIVLYNFAKINSGSVAAAFSGVFMLTYPTFLLFSVTIHPDMLLILTSALALAFAGRYADNGRVADLSTAGLFAGLAQAAKFGGPWLAPMLVLATFWGAGISARRRQTRQLWMFWRALASLAAFGALGFFAAAPHALIWADYWFSIMPLWAEEHANYFGLTDWLDGMEAEQGPLIATGWLAGLAFLCAGVFARQPHKKPITLAAVLAVTGVLWFGITGTTMVALYYLLLPCCLFTVVLGDLLQSACGRYLHGGRSSRTAVVAGIGILLSALATTRWQETAESITRRINVISPVENYTKFALHNLPYEAVILSDLSSVPYFDLEKFPNQVLRGTLKFTDIWEVNPDYIILSLSLANSPMYARMRQTQKMTMFDSYSYSVKLYQDLLGKNDDPERLVHAPVGWLDIVGTLNRAQDNRVEAVVYRVHPFGSAEGRPGPFSGGDAGGNVSAYAFDRAPTLWQSSQTGTAVAGKAFIGFDFGVGEGQALAAVQVKWHAPEETPAKIILQFRDGTGNWTNAAEYSPALATSRGVHGNSTETYTIAEVNSHREWRFVAAAPLAPGYRFAIEEIEFVEPINGTVRSNATEAET
jgi:Dolichyl-phosphate-mannose-protein mannosyltransferase